MSIKTKSQSVNFPRTHSVDKNPIILKKASSDSFVYDRNIEADIAVDDSVFAYLYAKWAESSQVEINGFAYINEEKKMIWAGITSKGTGTSVESSEEDMQWAMDKCFEYCQQTPNTQIHTHPSFDTYFSQTDINDMILHVSQSKDISETGFLYFIVYNSQSWCVRRVEWTPKGNFYNDGKAHVRGFALPQEKLAKVVTASSPKPAVTHPVTQYNSQVGWNSQMGWNQFYAESNVIETIPVKYICNPYFHSTKLTQIRNASKTKEDIYDLLTSLSYFDLIYVKNRLIAAGDQPAWNYALTTIEANEGIESENYEADDIAVFDEACEYMSNNDAIGLLYFIDGLDFLQGERLVQVLSGFSNVIKEVLTKSAVGYSLPRILLALCDNHGLAKDEEEIKDAERANERLLSSLPANVKSMFDAYDDLVAKIAEDTISILEKDKEDGSEKAKIVDKVTGD